MKEEIIKSRHRVQKHGEVFTPNWMVEKMLEVEGVKEACESLTSTFLEPGAGEGNFLKVILNRKLKMVSKNYSDTILMYENFSLYALSSIYGIELLEDNAQVCAMNLYEIYKESYSEMAMLFGENTKSSVLSSAKVIISANISQGNFLTMQAPDGTPIVFSEWRISNKLKKDTQSIKVSRTEHTLADIINGNKNEKGTIVKELENIEQLDLFDSLVEYETKIKEDNMKYLTVKITEVYKEVTESD